VLGGEASDRLRLAARREGVGREADHLERGIVRTERAVRGRSGEDQNGRDPSLRKPESELEAVGVGATAEHDHGVRATRLLLRWTVEEGNCEGQPDGAGDERHDDEQPFQACGSRLSA
jgi:hypothetical protein